MREVRARLPIVFLVPLLVSAGMASTGCDIVTADFKAKESAEWRKTYTLQPGGRLEINNVNGRIDVEPSAGNTVEVIALKTARAASAEAARSLLDRIEIAEDVAPGRIKVDTKVPRGAGFVHFGGSEVRYTVRVPASTEARFATVNGAIEVTGLEGRLNLETTSGGIRAREIAGPIEASTTNGGVEIDLVRIADPGVKLECTNGGIRLRVPHEAKATISARITNGGIDTGGLEIDTTESSRRRLEGRLNGGGPTIRLEGTNGGISITRRAGR
jgi:hypothetical protein